MEKEKKARFLRRELFDDGRIATTIDDTTPIFMQRLRFSEIKVDYD